MPEISRFLGIIIRMFFAENGHNLPHFHATYNEFSAVFLIEPLEQIQGNLPPRIYGIVMEWAIFHQNELMENWIRIQNEKPTKKIKPLV